MSISSFIKSGFLTLAALIFVTAANAQEFPRLPNDILTKLSIPQSVSDAYDGADKLNRSVNIIHVTPGDLSGVRNAGRGSFESAGIASDGAITSYIRSEMASRRMSSASYDSSLSASISANLSGATRGFAYSYIVYPSSPEAQANFCIVLSDPYVSPNKRAAILMSKISFSGIPGNERQWHDLFYLHEATHCALSTHIRRGSSVLTQTEQMIAEFVADYTAMQVYRKLYGNMQVPETFMHIRNINTINRAMKGDYTHAVGPALKLALNGEQMTTSKMLALKDAIGWVAREMSRASSDDDPYSSSSPDSKFKQRVAAAQRLLSRPEVAGDRYKAVVLRGFIDAASALNTGA